MPATSLWWKHLPVNVKLRLEQREVHAEAAVVGVAMTTAAMSLESRLILVPITDTLLPMIMVVEALAVGTQVEVAHPVAGIAVDTPLEAAHPTPAVVAAAAVAVAVVDAAATKFQPVKPIKWRAIDIVRHFLILTKYIFRSLYSRN